MQVRVFFCYAREDEALFNKIKTHLQVLQRLQLIDMWYDGNIMAGDERERIIREKIKKSQVILLLISPDFIKSDHCYKIAMEQSIERHKCGVARVIPILLRPVIWEETPLHQLQLQALPTNGDTKRAFIQF